MSTAGEEEARSVFQGDSGSFMVNWPYVYAAAQEAVAGGSLDQSVVDDIGWARYPAVEAGTPSAPPLGGINLGDRELHQVSGRGPGGGEVHHVAREQHRVHDQVGQSGRPRRGLRRPGRTRGVPDGRPDPRVDRRAPAPGPVTPYYGDVSVSVQRTWHPSESVDAPGTPEETDVYMEQVLQGERLL